MSKENNKPENPSAFPEPFVNDPNLAISNTPGMTLRDYFAAKAMQGFLTNNNLGNVLEKSGAKTMEDADDCIAITAYRLADAMLKQRES